MTFCVYTVNITHKQLTLTLTECGRGNIMKVKKNLMWSLSLIIIGVSTLIISSSNIIGTQLPDMLTRTLGIAELIALPFLVYSTQKIIWNEKGGK